MHIITIQNFIRLNQTIYLSLISLMNLLPKNYSQFRKKQYWDSFFHELQDQRPFDWYGTLNNFKQPLFMVLNAIYKSNNKQKQVKIAHLGCGNSTLPQDLLKAYPMFDFEVNNYDYSQAVIEEMKSKASAQNLSQKLRFQVCDLLKPIEEKLRNWCDLVLDKGTLDAILPEDKPESIKQIRDVYFKNAQMMLDRSKQGHIVIISMLQEFVLKTLLQYFYQHPHFTIHIFECSLPDSKLQPFLVDISFSPKSFHSPKPIELHLLTKAVEQFETPKEAIGRITELQQLCLYTEGIRSLKAGQLAKFNLHGKGNSLRYMLDIRDSEDKPTLQKNSCAAFIVPPGMENIFSSEDTIKQIHGQVASSRLIVVKTVVGQDIKNVQQVKEELNPVLPNLIPRGCDAKQVPYLTDGSFGQRHYLFRDDQIFIEEVLVDGDHYRRLILKNAPSFIQSQFKLAYFSEKTHPELREVSSVSLPPKKGLLAGVEPQFISQSYCKAIIAGLSSLTDASNGIILHLGAGAGSIPRFLHHHFNNSKQILVDSSKSVLVNCSKFFNWPQKDPRFEVIQDDALIFIQKQAIKDLSAIILDISCNQLMQQSYPPSQYIQNAFIQKCLNALSDQGVLIINTITEQLPNKPVISYNDLLISFKEVSLLYCSQTSSDNVVYFACKKHLKPQQINGENVIVIKNGLKIQKNSFEWGQEEIKNIELVYPKNGEKIKGSDLKVMIVEDQEAKKKKKKKKK